MWISEAPFTPGRSSHREGFGEAGFLVPSLCVLHLEFEGREGGIAKNEGKEKNPVWLGVFRHDESRVSIYRWRLTHYWTTDVQRERKIKTWSSSVQKDCVSMAGDPWRHSRFLSASCCCYQICGLWWVIRFMNRVLNWWASFTSIWAGRGGWNCAAAAAECGTGSGGQSRWVCFSSLLMVTSLVECWWMKVSL